MTVAVLSSDCSSIVGKAGADVRALSLSIDSNSLASFAAFLWKRRSALADKSSVEVSMVNEIGVFLRQNVAVSPDLSS